MRSALVMTILCATVASAQARAQAKAPPAAKKRATSAAARSVDLRPHRAVTEPGIVDSGHNTVVPPDDAARSLAQRIDGIIGSTSLKSAVNGVYVVDAASGEELYAYGADRQLNPASNTKLVSTATAFADLGADWSYSTRLVGPPADEDGVVHGDVQLLGQGDPTLGPGDLHDLAAHLAATGIRKITGSVLVSGEDRDALAHAWVSVTVSGGDKEGDHARVRVSPESSYYLVENGARTAAPTSGAKKRRPGVSVDTGVVDGKNGERLRIAVSGRVRAGQDVEVTRPVPRPALYAAHTLRAQIIAAGIDIEGGARQVTSEPPASAIELARHESVPLSHLAALINKPSNNFLADRLILTVAGEMLGERTMAAGVRAMGTWLDQIGVTPGTYRFENGSGLSHTIHISARQIAQVLLAGAKDEHIGKAWIDSLAVGGRDGTLRSRFAGHPAAGYVFGKTGTLNGVSALSGFVNVGDHSICFAVLTNGFRDRRKPDVRRGQAAIVDAIFGYLAAAVPTPPQALPLDGAAPGEDSEDVAAPDDQPASSPEGKPGVEL